MCKNHQNLKLEELARDAYKKVMMLRIAENYLTKEKMQIIKEEGLLNTEKRNGNSISFYFILREAYAKKVAMKEPKK